MNDQEIDFALSFMLEYPQAAVRVLEQSDMGQVAEFITQVPENYATPVLRQMLPEYAAKLSAILAPEKAAALMEDMEINAVANILRICPAEKRTAILAVLPKQNRQSVSLLLDYPTRSVGAWMTPHCLSLAEDARVSDALHYLKEGAGRKRTTEYLYIVDRDGSLKGRVGVMAILQASNSLDLTSLMDTDCPALHGQMLLEQAMEHKAWLDTDSLPVISRQRQFLGVINHSTLRKGLTWNKAGHQSGARGRDPVSSLFEVYGQSLLALFSTVSEAVDSETNK